MPTTSVGMPPIFSNLRLRDTTLESEKNSLPLQLFRQAIEIFAAVGAEDDHVFEAEAAEAGLVEAGLDGHDVAVEKFGAFVVQQRRLVDFQAHAVARAVRQSGRFVGQVSNLSRSRRSVVNRVRRFH